MNYEVVIGIEIHCELKTATKMFSGAQNSFGAKANSCVNQIDLAHPGTLPVVNKNAVKKAIEACAAMHLTIDPLVRFDRKNYYYSDLPKGYQITQQFYPIGRNGYLTINVDGIEKKIRVNRIHMEEDTAKQFHLADKTLIDFNRAGTPLIEIVSEPDIKNGAEAAAYVETMRNILYYLDISDVKMEEGSMRCDVNISLMPEGSTVFGVKNEIKNLNSISNVQKAIDYEIKRQKEILDQGGVIEQATRRFDEKTQTTILMRKKEGTVDYKFFPEPNIFPIKLAKEWIDEIIANLKELPEERFNRYKKDYGLKEQDIKILILNKELAELFEKIAKKAKNPKLVCNWILADIKAYLTKNNLLPQDIQVIDQLASLIDFIENQEISNAQAKNIFPLVMQGKDPQVIIEEKGIKQVSDQSAIKAIVSQVIDENSQSVIDYQNGKTRVVGFLVGQVMKKSKGQANPAMANSLILEDLKNRIK